MKNNKNFNRRQFLNLGGKYLLSLSVVYTIGCASRWAPHLNPIDSLKKLIFILGPWSATEF